MKHCFAHVPVFIDPMDGTMPGTPVIGAAIPVLTMPNGCVGNDCVILKAAIGTGFVFKGAIDATDGIPVINERLNIYQYNFVKI